MRHLIGVAILFIWGMNLWAGTVPLTTREVGLMLRSGYSSEAVRRELEKRHFGDRFDAAAEKQLLQAGADQALLETLRSGSYQASESELAIAEKKLAAQEQEQAEAIEQSAQPAHRPRHDSNNPLARPGTAVENPNEVYRLLKGGLVHSHQGSVVRFDDEGLERKKYFLFFFSANWAPAGRKFTPKLIEYYNRVEPQHPEFDVIFFSADRSQFGMETYLRESNMPWPAVDYPQIAAKAAGMESKIVREIPCLVLVDRTGQVLSQTGGGDKTKTPDQVLLDLDQILNGTNPNQVARSR